MGSITPSQPGSQCTSGSLEAKPERGAWKGRWEMGKVVSRASKSERLGHRGREVGREQGVGTGHSKPNAGPSWAQVAAYSYCHCDFGQVPPVLSW